MTFGGFSGGHYPLVLIEELQVNGSTWYAEHPDLPGCHAVGNTMSEAQENLDQSREAWLAWAQGQEMEVPEPAEDPTVSIVYAVRPAAARTKAGTEERQTESIPVQIPA
jgi:predicted RNase H-like HicB family nuclease